MIKIKIISVVILQKNDTKVNVTYQDSWFKRRVWPKIHISQRIWLSFDMIVQIKSTVERSCSPKMKSDQTMKHLDRHRSA